MKAHKKHSDTELMSLLRSENHRDQDNAFAQIYDDNYKSILSMVLKNNGNEQNCKDVFQDSIIILYKKVRALDFELSSKLSTYFYSIARKVWMKQLKRSSRVASFEDVDRTFVEVEDNAFEVLTKKENASNLERLFAQIGEDCQKVLRFFYYEKMKMEEIATIMGYGSTQVAKNKKFKCLNSLRSLVIDNAAFKN